MKNSKKVIAKSHFQKFQFDFFLKRRFDDLLQKTIFRQRLKFTHDKLKFINKKCKISNYREKIQKNRKKIKEHRNFIII